MLYIYIAKDDDDFRDHADIVREGIGSTIGALRDSRASRRIVILHRDPVCRHLAEAIDDGAAAEIDRHLEGLTAFVRRQLGAGAAGKITVLIHFGGRGREECSIFTRCMNEAADKNSALGGFRFIAVSRYNACPDGFFANGRLSLPDDAAVEAVVEQWKTGESEIPAFDHLRGIVLLCQALRAVGAKEREEKLSDSSWWVKCLWGDKIPESIDEAFSKAELAVFNENPLLNDFCRGIYEQLDLERYDDRLDEIAAEIAENLK